MAAFCQLFDSNDPWKMQKALDQHADFARYDEGLKIAVTKDHFYEMYHGNVGRKLSEYLPQQLFAWSFDDSFKSMRSSGEEVKVVRTGTITFNLGWWRRSMFWSNVVKAVPDGGVFPFSSVTDFDDCTKCPAKTVFTLKRGGIDGEGGEWKIVSLILIKLA